MSRMMSRCAFFSGAIVGVAVLASAVQAEDLVDPSLIHCRTHVPPALGAAPGGGPLSGGGVDIVGEWTGTDCGRGADIWGEGDYAYWGHFGTGCVDVINISDPTNPTFVSSFRPPNPDRFASAQDVKVHNGIGFIAYESDRNNGLGIVDFRDPANPVQLTTVTVARDGVTYDRVHNIFYSDGFLYITKSSTSDFAVIDLTDYDPDNPPAHISEMTYHVRNVGRQFVHDITIQGDRLYASAWSDIVVFDVSNIANEPPVRLGSAPGRSCHAAWATDDGAFVVTTEERSGGGAKLYSMTDDGNGGLDVTFLDEVTEGGNAFSAHNPIVVGDRVYTSWYESGMIIHEIDRNNGQLVEVGRVDPGDVWGVYPLLGLDRILLGGFSRTFSIVSAPGPEGCQRNPAWICDGDVDGDGQVNPVDSGLVQAAFGSVDQQDVCNYDVDCDGEINPVDSGIVQSLYGTCDSPRESCP